MGLRVGWLVLVEDHFGFGREREEGGGGRGSLRGERARGPVADGGGAESCAAEDTGDRGERRPAKG